MFYTRCYVALIIMEKKLIIKSENIKLTGKQFEELKFNLNNIMNLLQKIDKDIVVEMSGFIADYNAT